MPGAIATAFIRVRPDTHGFQRDVDQGLVPSLGRLTRTAGVVAGLAGGFAILHEAIVQPIKSAAEFEQQLNVLQATAGATSAQMKEVSAAAIRLGADTRLPTTSAKDAADAMTELAKTGFNVAQSMHAARGVLELSAAAQVDNATAAQIAGNAINSFGLRASASAHIADLLAGAANASSGGVTDMAEALQFAGSASHAAGQDVADVATAIAEMSNAGLSGSVAGSALAQTFRSIQSPTAKARDELHKLGINAYDAQGQMLPLRALIGQFSGSLDQLNPKLRAQALNTIFGSRAAQAARIVLAGGLQTWDKTAAGVTKVGAAQRLAEAQTKGLSGAVRGLQSGLETIQLRIGQAVLPALRNLAERGSGYIGRIAAAANFTSAVRISLSGLTGLAGEVAGQIRSALDHALHGSTSTTRVRLNAHQFVDVSTFHTGLAEQLGGAITQAVSGVDWRSVGVRIGNALGGAIHISANAITGLVSSLLDAVNAQKGRIAEVGLEIALGMLVDLLDPGFWISHWRLAFQVALIALTLATGGLGRAIESAVPLTRFIIGPLTRLGELLRVPLNAFGRGLLRGLEGIAPEAVRGADAIVTRILNRLFYLPEDAAAFFERMGFLVAHALRATAADVGSIAGNLVRLLFRPLSTIDDGAARVFSRFASVVADRLGGLIAPVGRLALRLYHGLIDPLAGIPGRIGSILSSIAGRISNVAGSVAGAMRGFANRVLSPVNSVLGFLHLPQIPTFAQGGVARAAAGARTPPQFAAGGVAGAAGGGFGVYRGVPGGVLRWLEDGPEAVIPLSRQRRGRAIEILNEVMNILGLLPEAAKGMIAVPRFDIGGIARGAFDAATGAARSLAGGVRNVAVNAYDLATDPIAWLKRHIPTPPHLGGYIGSLVTGSLNRLVKGVVGWVTGHQADGLVGRALAEARRMTSLHRPYLWGGGHGAWVPNGPWDCSGGVSQVLHTIGALSSPEVSGALMGWGKPGRGAIEVLANPVHTYMRINGLSYGTSSYNPGGGWGGPLPYGERGGFAVRHYALGTQFAPAGWGWVGERGPELMRFRGGEEVKSATDSARFAAGAPPLVGGDLTIQTQAVDADGILRDVLNDYARRSRRARR